MAKKGFPAKALLQLMNELAKKSGYSQDRSGVAALQRSKDFKEKGSIIGDRYLENRYGEYDKKVDQDPAARVACKEDYFDIVAQMTGYGDLRDFLIKNNHEDKKQEILKPKKNTEHLSKGNPPQHNEYIDKYVLEARLLPSFLGFFPLLVFIFFAEFADHEVSESELWAVKILCLGLVVGFSGWIATTGKKYDGKTFFGTGKKGFPTAYMMLYASYGKYTEEEKREYREKVRDYFGLEFQTKEEEAMDESVAIQQLSKAASRVNKTVKSVVIRSAIAKYGFHRNLVPASKLALTFATAAIGFSFWKAHWSMLLFQSLLFAAFLLYYLSYRRWIIKSSEDYARYLIDEFLSR